MGDNRDNMMRGWGSRWGWQAPGDEKEKNKWLLLDAVPSRRGSARAWQYAPAGREARVAESPSVQPARPQEILLVANDGADVDTGEFGDLPHARMVLNTACALGYCEMRLQDHIGRSTCAAWPEGHVDGGLDPPQLRQGLRAVPYRRGRHARERARSHDRCT